METKQGTILSSLELLLSRQTDWYKEITPQLIQLEKAIDFYQKTLNLDGERVEEEKETEVSKSPQTVADYTEFLLSNFRIISTEILNKLILLNEDLDSANRRLAGVPSKESKE